MSVLGALALVTLAGCGRSWFETREPWRREAEEQCLKSGAVREGPAVALLKPIDGPGACGADFPLKVAALGETPALSYVDEPLRPPGSVPLGGRAANQIASPVYVPSPIAAAPRAPVVAAPLPSSAPVSRVNAPLYRPDTAARDGYAPAPPGGGRDGPAMPPEYEGDGADAEPVDRPPRGPPAVQTVLPNSGRGPAAVQPVPRRSGGGPAAVLATAAVSPPATLACPIVSALDRWISESVQPAAQRWFGQPVVEIRQISAYSCRGMNGQPGARISEHAFGNALDIAAFTLADGRQVTVQDGWRGLPEEQGFLRDVQAAACEQFTTVLAPGSNAYHYNHIHVDLMRRASGRRICEPFAVSGEEAAARARARYARPGMRDTTGAVRAGPSAYARDIVDDEFDDEAN